MESSPDFQDSVKTTIRTLNNLARKSRTRTDWLIKMKVKALESLPKAGHFSNRKNEKDSLGISETDLEIVHEAEAVVELGKEKGRYISEEINPQGNSVSKALYFVFGDRHITGSYPEEGVEARSRLLKIFRDIGPKSRHQKANGESWSEDVQPTKTVDSARVTFEAVNGDIQNHDSITKDPKSVVGIINVGDEGGTELTLGDYAYITIEDDKEISVVEKKLQNYTNRPELTTQYFRVRGNHDSDINNKGLEVLSSLNQFSPAFMQEVGESHMILSIDTNLGSSFWFNSIVQELKKHPDQEELAKKAIAMVQSQDQLIKKSLENAKKENRDVIIIGHDEEIVRKMIPLTENAVTHIISGHYHKAAHEPTEIKNAKGQNIVRVRVGSPFLGMPGWEKEQGPQAYSVEVDPTQVTSVQIKSIDIPTNINDMTMLL